MEEIVKDAGGKMEYRDAGRDVAKVSFMIVVFIVFMYFLTVTVLPFYVR